MFSTAALRSALYLLAIAAALPACSAPQGDPESTSLASTVAGGPPHDARLTLLSGFGGAGQPPLAFSADAGKEAFVFPGEAITFSVPTYQLWPTLYPAAVEPYSDLAREQQLHAVIHVAGIKDGARLTESAVTTQGLRGGDGHTTFETFTDAPPFAVPSGVDTLELTVDVHDDANGTTKRLPYAIAKTTVLGSNLPDKTLLLDEVTGVRRERVLEGGALVKGSTIHVAFTDYRADNVAERYGIDRRIGRGRDRGAKDTMTEIVGTLEHEVGVGYAFDGAWSPEEPLVAHAPSRFVQGSGRQTFEASLTAPRDASKLTAYFHVRTYLKYDYDHRQYHEVALDHDEGSRVLVRERWDNDGGRPGQDYELTLEDR